MNLRNVEFKVFADTEPPQYYEQIARLQAETEQGDNSSPAELEARIAALYEGRRIMNAEGITGPDPDASYGRDVSILAFRTDAAGTAGKLCAYLRTVDEAVEKPRPERSLIGGIVHTIRRQVGRREYQSMWLAQMLVSDEIAESMEMQPQKGNVPDVMLALASYIYGRKGQSIIAFCPEENTYTQRWLQSLDMQPYGPLFEVTYAEEEVPALRMRRWLG